MKNIFVSDLFPAEELRELLRETGAGVETIRFSVADNLDDFERQMEAAREELKFLGSPALTVHGPFLDLGHAHCFSEYPVTEWAERLAGHIRHVHVHDNDGSRDAHLALGRGTIPVEETVRRIVKYSPGATWTVECTSGRDAAESIARLENCISELFMIE